MGMAMVYAPVRVTFTYVMRTREFESQGSPDRFGALSMSIKF